MMKNPELLCMLNKEFLKGEPRGGILNEGLQLQVLYCISCNLAYKGMTTWSKTIRNLLHLNSNFIFGIQVQRTRDQPQSWWCITMRDHHAQGFTEYEKEEEDEQTRVKQHDQIHENSFSCHASLHLLLEETSDNNVYETAKNKKGCCFFFFLLIFSPSLIHCIMEIHSSQNPG